MSGQKITPQQMFKAAQSPVSWLLSAEHLEQGAEAIIEREDQFYVPYLQAYDAAVKQAMVQAVSEGNKSGQAEILARVPNYAPAYVLYAYAIENVLKGLIVANEPQLINGDKLDKVLKDHDLRALAKRAGFTVHVQEESVLDALSELSVWAGRYPVALNVTDFAGTPNRDELMDYGSRNPIMRTFFRRAYQALEAKLPSPVSSRYGLVVVFRPPGA